MCPEALQGSWRIPCVAVPIVRMTGRLAIIKRRQALAVAKAVALPIEKTPEMTASPGLLRL
jgi:hypothetical protein